MRTGLGLGLGRIDDAHPPEAANLVASSGDFSSASWTTSLMTVAAAAAANPVNGVVDAWSFVEDSSAASVHQMFQTLAGASLLGVIYTWSLFVKPAGRNFVALGASGGAQAAWFDVSGGSVGTQSGGTGQIVNAGGGWFRCGLTVTGTGGAPNVVIVYGANANGSVTFNGAGTAAVRIYGPQVDLGSIMRPPRPSQ
jgi:hypothetical protein